MRYELLISWRYFRGDKTNRLMLLGAVAGVLIALVGAGLLLASCATSLAIVLVEVGLLAAVVFALLALFSVITAVSVLGVALGVASLISVLAVTSGFQREFRDRVLGVHAHVIVMKQTTFGEYRDVMRTAQHIDPDVLAVQPFILTEMLATRGQGELSGVVVKGVDPALVRSVLDLEEHMIEGTIDALAADGGALPPIIIGKQLAQKLDAHVGDTLTVVAPPTRTQRFRVAGIFYSGFDEYDRRFTYVSLREMQRLVGGSDDVMGVELKVKDIDRTGAIVAKLQAALGPSYQVQDWYETNENLFTMLNLQKLVLVIILTLIVIVAAVNMVSSLTLVVTDKTREIAILKAMGARSPTVARLFQCLGLSIGSLGTAIGVGVGLLTCYLVDAHGFRLDPKVYMIDRLPIEVRPLEVILVAAIAIAISVVATWVPARAAAALRPVDGLRYD